MAISARVLADSINTKGARLTTLEVTMPRIILAEFNTHRVFSRNSASSRAIPVQKIMDAVASDPFIPERFPINQPGMSATEYVEPGTEYYADARDVWVRASKDALRSASHLRRAGVHKQIANRLLEPWLWHQVIVSSTTWTNFFDLRITEHAQPEICKTAEVMRHALSVSEPVECAPGDWHLPLITEEDAELPLATQIRSSVARVAAVSYNRHADRDVVKETARYVGLKSNKHLSPFEHVAHAMEDDSSWANYTGWRQARWFIERNLEVA